MISELFSNTRRNIVAAGIVLVLLLAAWVAPFESGNRTVVAHFPQSIGIFEGSDVTIMGVGVGRVETVTPDGDSVRVEMTYSSDYKLPADVKAAIVTPTLVADRFIQLVPAYSGGPVLPDGGDIPLERSVVPVEMDQIYRSLNEITTSLGPNGANRDGALGRVLRTTAKSFRGNGQVGHDAIANLSAAARTLGDNSPELFATIESLAGVTTTLADQDKRVARFIKDLAKASTNLAGESGELRQALAAIADAVAVTQGFIRDNKELLVGDLARLSHTLKVISQERNSLKTTIDVAPLGIGNLGLQFDTISAGAGIRVQLGPTVSDLPNVLCGLVRNSGASNPDLVCNLFKALLPAEALGVVGGQITDHGVPAVGLPSTSTEAPTAKTPVLNLPTVGSKSLVDQVRELLGGAR